MSPLTDNPPRGLLRLILRMPIWLYRLNLGWLLGQRFLLLIHTGRKSGKIYQTVVEVVHHDLDTGIYTIASGWGETADWYRNIVKNPDVVIQVGRRKLKARAVPLSLDEAQEKLLGYAHKYPAAFRELSHLMMGEHLDATRDDILKMAEKIPLIDLHPQD